MHRPRDSSKLVCLEIDGVGTEEYVNNTMTTQYLRFRKTLGDPHWMKCKTNNYYHVHEWEDTDPAEDDILTAERIRLLEAMRYEKLLLDHNFIILIWFLGEIFVYRDIVGEIIKHLITLTRLDTIPKIESDSKILTMMPGITFTNFREK